MNARIGPEVPDEMPGRGTTPRPAAPQSSRMFREVITPRHLAFSRSL